MKYVYMLMVFVGMISSCQALQESLCKSEEDQKHAVEIALDVLEERQVVSGVLLLAQNPLLRTFIIEHSCVSKFASINLNYRVTVPTTLVSRDYPCNTLVLATGAALFDTENRKIKIWNGVTGEAIASPAIDTLYVVKKALLDGQPHPHALYSIKHYYDGRVYIVDPTDEEHVYYQLGSTAPIVLGSISFPYQNLDFLETVDFNGVVRVWDMRLLTTVLSKPQVAFIELLIQDKNLTTAVAGDAKLMFDNLPECWRKALERAYQPSFWSQLFGRQVRALFGVVDVTKGEGDQRLSLQSHGERVTWYRPSVI